MRKRDLTEPVKYTIGKWGDLPHYHCTLCPFETLKEAEMLTHIEEFHTPSAPPDITSTPIYDRFGNLIEEEKNG